MAVIDSGVHAEHPHVVGVAAATCLLEDAADTVDRLGHGTAVAAAIRDIAPGARLISGKVFDRVLSTNAATLAAAITWAADAGAHIINLSLGTPNHAREDLLRTAVSHAALGGATVVAAREVQGARFLPGTLPGVVSVVADPTLTREELIVADDVFVAAPYPRPIPGVPRERNLSGVSFAVAGVTAFVARLREAMPEVSTADAIFRALCR